MRPNNSTGTDRFDRVVWKITLEPGPVQGVLLPPDAKVVLVAAQGDDLCMWVDLNPEKSHVKRWFAVVGTGMRMHEDATHVGSALMYGGKLVWHLFELPEHAHNHQAGAQ